MRTQILPVIHYHDADQAMANAEKIASAGCDGLFLIQMQGENEPLIGMGLQIKIRYPHLKIGVNHLGQSPSVSLLYNKNYGIDMTWTDSQLTHTLERDSSKVQEIAEMLEGTGHQYFCAVAFKYQRFEPDPVIAALHAVESNMIPTTSGSATGKEASVEDVASLKRGLDNAPLALASGITPDNFESFCPHISHALVATGVSNSFYDLNEDLLKQLVQKRDALCI